MTFWKASKNKETIRNRQIEWSQSRDWQSKLDFYWKNWTAVTVLTIIRTNQN